MTYDPSAEPWAPLSSRKLSIPGLPSYHVSRPRLKVRLERATSAPVTCICAPAGSGKTSLAAEWAAARGEIGWLSLDANDNDPNTFWRYLVAALEAAGVPTDRIAANPGTTLLIDELTGCIMRRNEPVIVVLDDLDDISSRAITTSIALLLRRASPHLRLVLLARHDPPLPTARYRIGGSYTEIRGPELAFTASEASELVRRTFVSLSGAATTALVRKTQGWVGGLRLFLASAEGSADAAAHLATFDGQDHWVASYLKRELLDEQPRDMRAFLERTSIARRLPVGLAVKLSGRADAGAMLDRLVAQNALTESIEPGTYQYHPLFAQTLRMRQRLAHWDETASLHRRAADWLAQQGLSHEALHHATEAGDGCIVARLIVDEQLVVPMLLGYANRTRDRATQQISEFDMLHDPASAVVGAILALEANDDLRAQRLLDRVDLPDGQTTAPSVRFAREAIRLRLANRCLDGSGDACKHADDALAALADTSLHDDSRRAEARCLISAERAVALIADDRLDEAASTLAAARDLVPSGDALHLVAGLQALVYALRGNLSQGADLATAELRTIGDHGAHNKANAYCHLARAWIHAERSAPAAARADLMHARKSGTGQDALFWTAIDLVAQRVRDRASTPGSTASTTTVHANRAFGVRLAIMRSCLLIARGEAANARRMLANTDPLSSDGLLQTARALLALENPTEALGYARSALEVSSQPSLSSQIGAHLVLARAADRIGDANLASRSLTTALRLASPERIRRPFLEEKAWLRRSIAHLINDRSRYAWLGDIELVEQLHGATSVAPSLPIQPLTTREQDVLRKLAEGFPTQQIAADMHVSVNTTRTHLRNLYTKLGVRSRWDAICRARKLGLL